MNEVTRIHLSRQQFTIAVDAHRELKTYLADIRKKVSDKETVNEIESRMSELLVERGVTGEKVVLPEDVNYLKEQLGTPEDFDGDERLAKNGKDHEAGDKRLFRDSDNAIFGGVAAGVANYFDLDATLVRLAFAVLTIFSFGTGIVIYILLWLVVPPATTTSEKLQMHGTPVTLEALKESVNRADVSAKARRVNSSVLSFIDGAFRVAVKITGIGFIISGLVLIFGIFMTKSYMFLHSGRLFQENLFPVGAREQWLLGIGMGLAVIVSILLMLIGLAALRRKWPVRSWITGILIGLFLLGSAAATVLAADAAPRIRDRYEATLHTTNVKGIKPFSKVVSTGAVDLTYVSSPDYSVNLHYVDHPDVSKIKISVREHILYIDSRALDQAKHCTMLCLFPRYNMTVQIYAPNIQNFDTPPKTDIFYPAIPPLPVKSEQ